MTGRPQQGQAAGAPELEQDRRRSSNRAIEPLTKTFTPVGKLTADPAALHRRRHAGEGAEGRHALGRPHGQSGLVEAAPGSAARDAPPRRVRTGGAGLLRDLRGVAAVLGRLALRLQAADGGRQHRRRPHHHRRRVSRLGGVRLSPPAMATRRISVQDSKMSSVATVELSGLILGDGKEALEMLNRPSWATPTSWWCRAPGWSASTSPPPATC